MLLIVGTIRVPPERLDLARPAMQAMVLASRAEDGCCEYHYAEDVLDPGLIHVKELWSDRKSLERHFESDHIRAWRSQWPALDIGERDLRLYDVGDAQPI